MVNKISNSQKILQKYDFIRLLVLCQEVFVKLVADADLIARPAGFGSEGT